MTTSLPASVDSELFASILRHSLATNASLPEPRLPPISTVDVTVVDHTVTVHHRDSGDDAGVERAQASGKAPTYVLVHGLGGSLANWEPLWPFLTGADVGAPVGSVDDASAVDASADAGSADAPAAADAKSEPRIEPGRVLAPDLAGFGRTPGAHGSAVADNVALLAAYLEELALTRVVLVGNSMGGMIAAMVAAERPDLVERLVLIDPVLPLHPGDRPRWDVLATFTLYLCPPAARFVVPRYVQRRGLEQMGVDGVLTVVADPRRVPRWVMRRAVEETVALAEVQDAVPALVRAANSLVVAAASPRYRRALGAIALPVTLVHGEKDRLVAVTGARRAARVHPSWRYVEGAGVGHVPMAEAAEWVAGVVAGVTPS